MVGSIEEQLHDLRTQRQNIMVKFSGQSLDATTFSYVADSMHALEAEIMRLKKLQEVADRFKAARELYGEPKLMVGYSKSGRESVAELPKVWKEVTREESPEDDPNWGYDEECYESPLQKRRDRELAKAHEEALLENIRRSHKDSRMLVEYVDMATGKTSYKFSPNTSYSQGSMRADDVCFIKGTVTPFKLEVWPARLSFWERLEKWLQDRFR